MSIITDENKIAAVLERSVDTIYPGKDELEKKLRSGEQLRVYMGIDPTNTYAHLGHATNYLMLRRFWELGHKVIVLVGDFTAMIGDPSDKKAARKRLTEEEVKENMQTFRTQIGRILPLDDVDNPIEFRFNSEWLSTLNFREIVDLASNFTVQRMLERDVFERRVNEEKPLYVHEFFYPLMQGYDSVALEADIEIGGTDQTFNMLAGRTLRKRIQDKEKYVITTTLLENPETGEKLMSKSKGTGVPLDAEPDDMFAKIMALPDAGIVQMFIDCTNISLDAVSEITKKLDDGANPRDVKLDLAFEIVELLYDENHAEKAQESFINTFSNQETPDDVNEVPAAAGDKLIDIFTAAEVVPSKSQFRRLVDQGAVTNTDTDEKVTDHNATADTTTTFKVGKHRFIKVVI